MKNYQKSNHKFRYIKETILYDNHHDEYFIMENGQVVMQQGKLLLTKKEYLSDENYKKGSKIL